MTIKPIRRRPRFPRKKCWGYLHKVTKGPWLLLTFSSASSKVTENVTSVNQARQNVKLTTSTDYFS